MKILIPHREIGYFYGGAENHIKELTKRLLANGNEIIILTEKGDGNPLNEIKKLENLKIIYLPTIKLRHSNKFKKVSENVSIKVKKFRSLTKYLRLLNNFEWMLKCTIWIMLHRREFDVIWSSRSMDTTYIKLLNKFVKIPYIVSLEGYDFIEAENTKDVKYVFAISPFICQICEQKHGFVPSLIPIGIDVEQFHQLDEIKIKEIRKRYCPNNEFMVLNVARLVDSKDITTFIKAASIVTQKYSKVVFLVCGNGSKKEELQALITKLGLEKNFFLLFGIGKELIQYYGAADLFVHVPKVGNHFGVVYLEAMAAGLPIIAANKDATPYTVGDAALLVTPENEKELSSTILKLITNSKLRRKLSNNSGRRAKKEFNWDYIVPKIEILFKKAITKENYKDK